MALQFRALTLSMLERPSLAFSRSDPLISTLCQRLERTARWSWASEAVRNDLQQQTHSILADQLISPRLVSLLLLPLSNHP
jgi:hypothetical protein